jgi:competence protein ComEC
MFGMLYQPLGQALAWLSWPFAVYSIRTAELFAALPGSAIGLGETSLGWVVAFYLALFGLTFFGGHLRAWIAARTGGRPLSHTALLGVALLGLGLLAVLVWRAALLAPDGRLHVTVLDVGSGDALLVQSPTGRYLLVDGGPSPTRLADALGRRLPLGKRLDWLLVAGGSEEQVAALPALIERAPPEQVLWAGPTSGSRSARRLQELFSQAQIQPVLAETGRVLDLGGGVQMEVVAIGPRGAVLLLEWGSFRALLPVGIDFDTLETLQNDPSLGEVTALLLADSGYAPANPPEWIAKLSPQVILLSVAAGDREGRPDPETLEAVRGYTLLRTDHNGWIELTTDGEQLWVEVERR